MKRLIRVFPRQTKASPTDELAYFGPPDLFAEADEVHVSVTFSADIPTAEQLAEQWKYVAPVKVGGVAYGDTSMDFIPGRYIKPGYTFTSRGCPRKCWFCDVWRKWPKPVPMRTIHEGWNVLDDNLLACPREHVEKVFAMLRRQNRRVTFTGGLEAFSLEDYHIDLLTSLSPRPAMYFAYDPGDEFETLRSAATRLIDAGFSTASHRMGVYVLVGYPKDTMDAAQTRMKQMISIGFTPYAMLWEPTKPSQRKWKPAAEWKQFRRCWIRPAIIHAKAA